MSDPFLRCEKCGQRVTAEMDDNRHCELLDRLSAQNARLREALEECAKPPYRDSDLSSLIQAINAIARTALEGK